MIYKIEDFLSYCEDKIYNARKLAIGCIKNISVLKTNCILHRKYVAIISKTTCFKMSVDVSEILE